jgi:hypothetical protein
MRMRSPSTSCSITIATPRACRCCCGRVNELTRPRSIRIAHLQLEQQLSARLVPYARLSSKATAPSLADVPLLALRLDDVLPGATAFAHRLVAVQIASMSPSKPCRVAFHLRLVKALPGLADELADDEASYDASTRLLVARYADDADATPAGGPLASFFELLATLARLAAPKAEP